MKMTMGKQFIKEGLSNIIRHPIVTLASVSTIAMMLVLMGSFLIFSENANQIAKSASQQPPVLLWMEYEISIEAVEEVERILSNHPEIKSYTKQTPEENFEQFKNELGEDSDILDGFNPDLLPYTFTVQLFDTSRIETFKTGMEGIFGVRKVEYSQPVTDFLNRVRSTVNLITMLAFIVLCGITLFIISNMVRIAVYSRSEEIGIMKYVGATNTYIRIPFIIEGSAVGFLGALIAIFLVLFAYSLFFGNPGDSQGGLTIIQLVPLSDLYREVIAVNILLGVMIGAGGSALSVRRHVRV
jgi:cell division transport system permease protein